MLFRLFYLFLHRIIPFCGLFVWTSDKVQE